MIRAVAGKRIRFRQVSEETYGKKDRSEFARELKAERIKADLSVAEVSEIVSLTSDYIYKLERGESPTPADERISQLAGAIGANEDRLFAAAGRISPEVRGIISDMPVETGKVIRKLKPLGAVGRAYVLERMEQAIQEVFDENKRRGKGRLIAK